MIYANWDDTPDATNWLKVVAIVQAAFHDGTLAEECTWQAVVLISKGASRDFRGIGMMELLWKTVTSLLNLRLTTTIKLHDVLQGFQAVQGTGTASLKAKLIQQLSAMREAVLFKVFLDLKKEYDALDRDRFLEILGTYGFGHKTVRLFRMYWDYLNMVDRAGGYFGLLFKGYCSVTQGDLLYPTLFDVVMDTVIRHSVTVVAPTAYGLEVRYLPLGELAAYLYAGNGLIK